MEGKKTRMTNLEKHFVNPEFVADPEIVDEAGENMDPNSMDSEILCNQLQGEKSEHGFITVTDSYGNIKCFRREERRVKMIKIDRRFEVDHSEPRTPYLTKPKIVNWKRRESLDYTDTVTSMDTAILSKQKAENEEPGFITRTDSTGNLKRVVEDTNEDGPEFLSSTFFGRPLGSFVGQEKKWNPFRKKSGILSVIHAQAKKNRIVSKHGRINTVRKPDEISEGHRFLKDFFTSMIELTWGLTFFSFAASFYISWLLFAIVWYVIAVVHGDLDPEKSEDHLECVESIKDFTTSFLFSLELQHTIGFGGRATTNQCPVAVIVMTIQSIVGVVIQACMAGILFAKFTKPTNRGETIIFSKNALVTLRNGVLYLVVRVGDIRPTHLIECHASGHILRREQTEEGEVIPYSLSEMVFGAGLDGSQEFFQMIWPITLCHKIDSASPMYEMGPREILSKQFEIVVTVEGTTPETGNSIQVRTSYLPNEILWGYRFEHTCVAYDKQITKYMVSYTTINRFSADRTPRSSAKTVDEKKKYKLSSISTNIIN